MRKIEIAALIKMVYDFHPDLEKTDGYDLCAYQFVNEYLKRKGYLHNVKSPMDGTPTRKAYKILKKYKINIKDLEDSQKEFNDNGYVIETDKFGISHKA